LIISSVAVSTWSVYQEKGKPETKAQLFRIANHMPRLLPVLFLEVDGCPIQVW